MTKTRLYTLFLVALGVFFSMPQSVCALDKPDTLIADNHPDVELCFNATSQANWPEPGGFSAPFDVMGVVGPEQFVMLINQGFRSFDKKTGERDLVLEIDASSFFSEGLMSNGDPRIRFDSWSNRWYAICFDSDADFNNNLYIAVSDCDVLTSCTKWKIFRFQHNLIPNGPGSSGNDDGAFLDYPTLGIDENALYIGCNMFDRPVDTLKATLYVIGKQSLIDACDTGVDIVAFRNFPKLFFSEDNPRVIQETPQGADNVSDIPLGFGVVITAKIGGNTIHDTLSYYRVHNPGFHNGMPPSLEGPIDIFVPMYGDFFFNEEVGISRNAPNKGNLEGVAGLIESVPGRLMVAHVNVLYNKHGKKDFRLYTTHATFVNDQGVVNPLDLPSHDRIALRWYEIKDLDTQPVAEQVGTVFDDAESSPRYYYMPSIMTNVYNDMLLCSSTSSENEFIDAVCFRRFPRKGDPLNEVRDPLFLTASNTPYNFMTQFESDNGRGRRWGDYTMTSLDCDKETMWTIQEYCNDYDNAALPVVAFKAPKTSNIPPFPQP